MQQKNKSPDQKTGIIINDQIDRSQLFNPGCFSLIDKEDLTKDIPTRFKFDTISLKSAAAKLGYSLSQMRAFCQVNPGIEVGVYGNGYHLNGWTVEVMAALDRHVKSRQRINFDILEVKTDGQ
jgi:hypothetical protein